MADTRVWVWVRLPRGRAWSDKGRKQTVGEEARGAWPRPWVAELRVRPAGRPPLSGRGKDAHTRRSTSGQGSRGALAATADGFVSPRVAESPQHCSLRGLQRVVVTGVADGRGTVGTK